MDAKDLVTIRDELTGEMHTYHMITGERIQELQERERFAYTVEAGMKICALIREGQTLKQIASLSNSPSLHLIYYWKGKHPDFALAMTKAKADRAEYFRDKAVDVLEDTTEDDDVRLAKFKFDGYTKLAAQDNPAEFGQKREEGGSAPTQIIINTGVPLGEQPIIEVNQDGTIRQEGTED